MGLTAGWGSGSCCFPQSPPLQNRACLHPQESVGIEFIQVFRHEDPAAIYMHSASPHPVPRSPMLAHWCSHSTCPAPQPDTVDPPGRRLLWVLRYCPQSSSTVFSPRLGGLRKERCSVAQHTQKGQGGTCGWPVAFLSKCLPVCCCKQSPSPTPTNTGTSHVREGNSKKGCRGRHSWGGFFFFQRSRTHHPSAAGFSFCFLFLFLFASAPLRAPLHFS